MDPPQAPEETDDLARDHAIIDVLAHLQSETHASARVDDPDTDEDSLQVLGLQGWTVDQLKAEVIRLRRVTEPSPSASGSSHPLIASRTKRKRQSASARGSASKVQDKKSRERAGRDEGTGKRLEKGRKTELRNAIRAKMRQALNTNPDDPLPPPTPGKSDVDVEPSLSADFVPNWLSPSDAENTLWLERLAAELLGEAQTGQWPKIPSEDLDLEVILSAAKTAFSNFCRRYVSETDPEQAVRKGRYAKGRRRWARKDLKQKKRAKAALDPLFHPDTPHPPSALHIDYMSSEYSSAGEDPPEDEVAPQRREMWASMLALRSEGSGQGSEGKGGWAQGLGEKVLEVRTPRWRSDSLHTVYRQLDTISSQQASARANPGTEVGGRAGHVAPSHWRFTLPYPLMRNGRTPRVGGERWMWASGEVGVWPDDGGGVGGGAGEEGWREEETRGLMDALKGIQEET